VSFTWPLATTSALSSRRGWYRRRRSGGYARVRRQRVALVVRLVAGIGGLADAMRGGELADRLGEQPRMLGSGEMAAWEHADVHAVRREPLSRDDNLARFELILLTACDLEGNGSWSSRTRASRSHRAHCADARQRIPPRYGGRMAPLRRDIASRSSAISSSET
jgi:hypothetical protein